MSWLFCCPFPAGAHAGKGLFRFLGSANRSHYHHPGMFPGIHKEDYLWHFLTAQSVYCRLSSWLSVPVLVSGVRSTCWKGARRPVDVGFASTEAERRPATITPARMLMYGKEASNRKQEIDRQHYTIPNQRPKDKHCGKI